MTTAHRPTWKAAVGQANEGGWSAGGAVSTLRSNLDAPAHTKLKIRQLHQVVENKNEVLRKSLLELEQIETTTKHQYSSLPRKPIDINYEERTKLKLLKNTTADVDVAKIKSIYDDSDVDDDDSDEDNSDNDADSKKGDGTKNNDASDDEEDTDLDDDDSDSDEDDDDDDDDDDEAALQAELEKIRAEREAVKIKEEMFMEAEENARLEQVAALGNPLLNMNHDALRGTTSSRTSTTKRRWNDDVVFRNQAKGEPQPKKRFINDTVRNDFHKRFLNKFIR